VDPEALADLGPEARAGRDRVAPANPADRAVLEALAGPADTNRVDRADTNRVDRADTNRVDRADTNRAVPGVMADMGRADQGARVDLASRADPVDRASPADPADTSLADPAAMTLGGQAGLRRMDPGRRARDRPELELRDLSRDRAQPGRMPAHLDRAQPGRTPADPDRTLPADLHRATADLHRATADLHRATADRLRELTTRAEVTPQEARIRLAATRLAEVIRPAVPPRLAVATLESGHGIESPLPARLLACSA
jgi:hypothetical protein